MSILLDRCNPMRPVNCANCGAIRISTALICEKEMSVAAKLRKPHVCEYCSQKRYSANVDTALLDMQNGQHAFPVAGSF